MRVRAHFFGTTPQEWGNDRLRKTKLLASVAARSQELSPVSYETGLIHLEGKMNKNTIIEIKKETTLHLAEHEILLTFNYDSDVELFETWWLNHGLKDFTNWVQSKEKQWTSSDLKT